ncbi:MAG: putative Ig domain-containing protein [Deltaproteobacteria bacterium]|nr:putative Ig domain-containing protein [Deltaproteobacteria bacterium]
MMRSILRNGIFILAVFLICWLPIRPAYGAGTFISAPDRVDMVHDPSRNILYITSGTDVLVYQLDTKQFLAPFALGTTLRGIDLSPDGNTLAVADASSAGIYLIDLQTRSSRKVSFSPPYSVEGGSSSVAFGIDGSIVVSPLTLIGSLRRYNPATEEVTPLLEWASGDMMVCGSADGKTIGYFDQSWGPYRVLDGSLVERTVITNVISSYYGIGTNRNGTQFAIPTSDGTYVYNTDFVQIATLGRRPGVPVGVVYAPSEDIVYFAWAETQEVRAFETADFAQVASYNFEDTFKSTGNPGYQQGRLKISRDGTLLFAAVEGGIRYVNTGTDATPAHPLTIQTTGAGAGSVTSSPEGIYCPSVCTRDYPGGSRVTLSARAHQGSVFAGWSGAGCSGTEACTVSIDGETTVTATFSKGHDLGRSHFIPSPDSVDMVHDPGRNILYITSGADVVRYDVATQQFLTPFWLGGDLKGIDLSPDANMLAVADRSIAGVHLIDLQTGSSRKVLFPQTTNNAVSFSVAFGSDGNMLVSSQSLLKYNSTNGEVTTVLQPVQGTTMLSASADGSVIGFAEGGRSDGPWGRYRVNDGDIVERIGYTDGTGWSNYEIGTNRNGTQFALPTAAGMSIYDADFRKITTLGEYAGPHPTGVVYDPSEDIVYFAWGGTREVRAFETTHFTQVNSYNFEYTFLETGNQSYKPGRLKMSRDGSLLFVIVEGGIRYTETHLRGDIDRNGTVGLDDAIGALQVASGVQSSQPFSPQADVDGDHRIGGAESVYALQVVSGLRGNNRNPVLNVSGEKTCYEGQWIYLTVSATDPDNDPLVFSATSLPAGAGFDPVHGTFSWRTASSQTGIHPVTFTVTDDFGGQTSETVNIIVNEYPLFVAGDYYPLNVGDWIDYDRHTLYSSGTGRVAVTGTKIIGDAVTKVVSYTGGATDYYTSDENGTGVKFYGEYDPSSGEEVLFVAPLVLIPGDMAIGTSSDCSSSWTFDYSGTTYHVEITAHTSYMALEDVQTENETLHDCIKMSMEIDQHLVEKDQSLSTGTRYFWYYRGVGIVKEAQGSDTSVIKRSYINGVLRNY